MMNGILVPLHIILSPSVVATRVITLRFLLRNIFCSSIDRVMRPQMTVEVFDFCGFVGAARTFAGSAVVVLVFAVVEW